MHKHAKVFALLAQRPSFHVHYTPTYASWLNQVERWLGIITQRAIRRGSFSGVKELIAKIEQFVAAYHKTKAPFNWTATADSILEKLERLCSQISGTGHEPLICGIVGVVFPRSIRSRRPQDFCLDAKTSPLSSPITSRHPEQVLLLLGFCWNWITLG
jgi:hypothetical protein